MEGEDDNDAGVSVDVNAYGNGWGERSERSTGTSMRTERRTYQNTTTTTTTAPPHLIVINGVNVTVQDTVVPDHSWSIPTP